MTAPELPTLGALGPALGVGPLIGLGLATSAAGAACAPSGAVVVVVAVNVGCIVVSVTDPFALFSSASTWGDVAGRYNSWQSQLNTAVGEFGDSWEGPAAEAFGQFWTHRLSEVLTSMSELMGALSSVEIALGTSVLGAIGTIVAGDIMLLVEAMAANAAAAPTAGASLLLQWGMVAKWAAIVVGVIGAIAAIFTAVAALVFDIKAKLGTLLGQISADGASLDQNNLQVPLSALPPIRADIEAISEQFTVKES